MSTVILLVVFLGAQSPAASPCTAPEYRQFDFWVGDWIVHNPKGQQVGANRIEAIENGCGILEQWTNARGTTGRSINIYRPSTGTWVQAWAGSDGLTLVLEGRFDRGKMVLQGESRAPTGAGVRDRVTWSVLDGGKVHQFWEQSADGGNTWTVAFDGTYVRRSP